MSSIDHNEIRLRFSRRNPAVLNVLQFFEDKHLHPELREALKPIQKLAFDLVDKYADGAELTVALRSLLDVRTSVRRHHLICCNFVLPHQRPESLEDAPSPVREQVQEESRHPETN